MGQISKEFQKPEKRDKQVKNILKEIIFQDENYSSERDRWTNNASKTALENNSSLVSLLEQRRISQTLRANNKKTASPAAKAPSNPAEDAYSCDLGHGFGDISERGASTKIPSQPVMKPRSNDLNSIMSDKEVLNTIQSESCDLVEPKVVRGDKKPKKTPKGAEKELGDNDSASEVFDGDMLTIREIDKDELKFVDKMLSARTLDMNYASFGPQATQRTQQKVSLRRSKQKPKNPEKSEKLEKSGKKQPSSMTSNFSDVLLQSRRDHHTLTKDKLEDTAQKLSSRYTNRSRRSPCKGDSPGVEEPEEVLGEEARTGQAVVVSNIDLMMRENIEDFVDWSESEISKEDHAGEKGMGLGLGEMKVKQSNRFNSNYQSEGSGSVDLNDCK